MFESRPAGKNIMRPPIALHANRSKSRSKASVTSMSPADDETLVHGFGPHLVFDGRGCPRERLDDLVDLYRVLDTLPDRIGMTKIMPPYVFRHRAIGEAGEGLSGFVLIAESHISMHTFPDQGCVNVDIFSCENFDVEDALSELRREFAPSHVEWKLLDRGVEFPKHIARSCAIVARDRKAVARVIGLEASS